MRHAQVVALLCCATPWVVRAGAPNRCLRDDEVGPAVARVHSSEASRIDTALKAKRLERVTLESMVLSAVGPLDTAFSPDAGPGPVVFIGDAEPLFARRGSKLFRVRRPSRPSVITLAACSCPVLEPAGGERGPPEAAAPTAVRKGWVLPEGVSFAGVVDLAVAPTTTEVTWGAGRKEGCPAPAALP